MEINPNILVSYGSESSPIEPFIEELSSVGKVLFVTTSTRSDFVSEKGEKAKSTQLAYHLADILKRKGTTKVEVVDAPSLKIYDCLGCVSELNGNMCGVKEAAVKDKSKNPTGNLRCWASHDYEDDELWKIVNPLYEADVVVFFSSQRWGNANAIYQRIIERLDWIENMHSTLGEPSTTSGKKAGFVLIGQNWRVKETLDVQKQVLDFYGFETPTNLFMGWQFTRDSNDESTTSYQAAPQTFDFSWNMELYIPQLKESRQTPSFKISVKNFSDFLKSLG